MKNKSFFSIQRLIILILLFIVPVSIEASQKLVDQNLTLECVYEDGNVYTFNRKEVTAANDSVSIEYNISQEAYPLDTSSQSNLADVGEYLYDESALTGDVGIVKCPPIIAKQIHVGNENDMENKNIHVAFSKNFKEGYYAERKCFIFCWDSDISNELGEKKIYKLLSENILMNDFSNSMNSWNYYRQDENEVLEQASSTRTYVNFYKYYDYLLISKGERMTAISAPDRLFEAESFSTTKNNKTQTFRYIYLNDPTPDVFVNSNGRILNSFKDKDPYFYLELSKTEKSTERYIVSEVNALGDSNNEEDICEHIPKTAEVLQDIIKIVQYLVPSLLIVLVGLDIAKIVTSGNPEEDLPKKKKSIITRCIVAVSIFFLPVIMRMILNFINPYFENEEVIADVSCLFSDNIVYDETITKVGDA